jgi:hypothetical protein
MAAGRACKSLLILRRGERELPAGSGSRYRLPPTAAGKRQRFKLREILERELAGKP